MDSPQCGDDSGIGEPLSGGRTVEEETERIKTIAKELEQSATREGLQELAEEDLCAYLTNPQFVAPVSEPVTAVGVPAPVREQLPSSAVPADRVTFELIDDDSDNGSPSAGLSRTLESLQDDVVDKAIRTLENDEAPVAAQNRKGWISLDNTNLLPRIVT